MSTDSNGSSAGSGDHELVSFVVSDTDAGGRLDVVIARHLDGESRSRASSLIKGGLVSVDGTLSSRPAARARYGDSVSVRIPPPEPCELQPEDIPLAILHEDHAIIVIDKPAGMVVHPARGHHSGTVVHALLGHGLAPAPGDEPRKPGIVHRLDKDTSGCLVVAKTARARAGLEAQFRARQVSKIYLAVVRGQPPAAGEINAPVGRDPKDRKRMSVRAARGRESLSRYRVVERFPSAALVEVRIATGRTHQIRVHLESLGFPVLGDEVYGRGLGATGRRRLGRQALHAAELGFCHPETGRWMVFQARLPIDIEGLLAELRGECDVHAASPE